MDQENPWGESSTLFEKDLLETRILCLEEIRSQPSGPDTISHVNSLFREIHSLKGTAALLRLDALRDFLHVYEEALGAISRNALKIKKIRDMALLNFFLSGLDLIENAIQIGSQQDELVWRTEPELINPFLSLCGKARQIAAQPELWLELDELDEELF